MSSESQKTKILQQIVVKAENPSADVKESFLSCIDTRMPPVPVYVWFFYDYNISVSEFQSALSETLNRYQELSGRIAFNNPEEAVIKLTNEGAVLNVKEPAAVSLDELIESEFDNDLLLKHFAEDNYLPREYLLEVNVQNLADNKGMMVNYGIHHWVADINSTFLFVADFASQLSKKSFKFQHDEMITCKRSQYLKSSGSDPVFEHGEFDCETTEAQMGEAIAKFIADLHENPRKCVRLSISLEQLKALKKEVYETGKRTCQDSASDPSTNDCLISVIWRSMVSSAELDREKNPKEECTFSVAVNARFRREPPLPKTFFGNFVMTKIGASTFSQLKSESIMDTASKVRANICTFNKRYIQSVVDFMHKNKQCQFKGLNFPMHLVVTNWNKYFDWYQDCDLGQGRPLKVTVFSSYMDKCCIIMPGADDDSLELIFALEKKHMVRFLHTQYIQKYFQFNKKTFKEEL